MNEPQATRVAAAGLPRVLARFDVPLTPLPVSRSTQNRLTLMQDVTGTFTGNFPQAFSRIGIIASGVNLARAGSPA